MTTHHNKLLIATLTSEASKQGKNLRGVVIEAGIDVNRYVGWMKGISEPSTDDISLICNILGCDQTYILTEVNKGTKHSAKPEEKIKPEPKVNEKSNEKPKPELKVEEKTELKENPVPEAGKADKVKKEVVEEQEREAEEKMEEPMVEQAEKTPEAKSTKTERKPRTTKPKTPVTKPVEMSEGMELIIRKTAGLKKAEAIKAEDVMLTMDGINSVLMANIHQMNELANILCKMIERNKVDDRLTELMTVASAAEDEDIAFAVKMLKKCQK